MREPIVAPDLGMADVIVSVWYVKPGETVYAGDRVVELLVGGATFDVAAPCAGTLREQCVLPPEGVSVGQVLGFLDA
ncbi:MAG TPA: biotin/lipoyl-containing protein [Gemmataceae bacterium]|nr:biotin/lipoyl-containing protein [Gemmataceae bacterium]